MERLFLPEVLVGYKSSLVRFAPTQIMRFAAIYRPFRDTRLRRRRPLDTARARSPGRGRAVSAGLGAPAPPSPAADPGAPTCASELGASLPSRAVLSPPSPLPSHPKAGGGQAGRRAARPSQGRIRGGRSPRPWGPPPRPAAQARAAGGIPGRGCSGFIWFSFQPREAAGRGGARGRQFHSAVKRQTKPVFLQLAGGGGASGRVLCVCPW